MPFCKICGEYHLENEMTSQDICVYCDKTLNHKNQFYSEDDFEDEA
jgi:hypothetical protein